MQIEVTELTVNPRRLTAAPVVTIATPLARFRIAWRNSIAWTDGISCILKGDRQLMMIGL